MSIHFKLSNTLGYEEADDKKNKAINHIWPFTH